ncbi:hypothetical protein LCGC14_2248520 [marine sediment metagenome]|uniref:Uncharacterized protein n=1 Tax=marine sediment metagenome TaxID=412755 RepID=A0A0F9FFT9_9ZZZZ
MRAIQKETHTPGPWNVDTWDWWLVRAAASHRHLATVHVEHNGKNKAKANARLIASAPDLLEALKACDLYVAFHMKGIFDEDAQDETLRKLRAAIAKAEGP